MGTKQLEDYLVEASGDLPTVPSVASRVIEAVDDEKSSVADVRALIEQDAALAARIMKVSNSSMYSFATEICSLEQGLSLLGGRTVKNLVMAVAMREVYQNFGPVEQRLWEHTTAAGPVAAALAERVGGVDTDEAFTVGLLHDIGKAALANSHHEEYEQVVARVDEKGVRYSDAERDVFGFDHAELGARVAERWELPERLVTVIRCHHDLDALSQLPEPVARLTALVGLATASLTHLGSGRAQPIEDLDLSGIGAWSFLGLCDDDLEPIIALCQERIESAQVLCT